MTPSARIEAHFSEPMNASGGSRRGSKGRGLRVPLLGAVLMVAAAALFLWYASSATAASDGFTYFPSPSTTDGRMLVIAGDMNTLSGSTVTVSFSIASTQTTFAVGFFDGNANSAWDVVGGGLPLETTYTVYADPTGSGTGTIAVASFTSAAMAADAWSDFSINQTAAALAPSGRYFYYVRAATTLATRASYNAFKVRVQGSSYITPLQTFGFIGAYRAGITTTATYDGTFDFWVEVPQGKDTFDVWDGDVDRGDDTDDPNTPASVPTWSVPAAIAEGVNAGAPADDGGANPIDKQRSPSVYYTITLPDGTTSYTNNNPSGGREWELYRLGTSSAGAPGNDVTITSVPAGLWKTHFVGLDAGNLNALRFDSPILGVDASGTIVRPDFPYRIGDRVWLDANRNGAQDSGETSITGAILTLRDGNGSFIQTASVDASGAYEFTTLPGTYTVDVNDPGNWVSGGPLAGLTATTSRLQSAIIVATNVLTLDFGLAKGPALVVDKVRASLIAVNRSGGRCHNLHGHGSECGRNHGHQRSRDRHDRRCRHGLCCRLDSCDMARRILVV